MKKLTLILLALTLLFANINLSRSNPGHAVSLASAQNARLQIYALDIGQGDSLLIVSPTGKSVLIDAGVPGSGTAILDAMSRHNVGSIDLMIASHAHADHIGAADEVLRATHTQAVLDSGVPNPTVNYRDFLQAVRDSTAPNGRKTKFIQASPGQTFDLGGGAKITVLAPIKPFFTKSQLRSGANEPNANSVVIRLAYGTFSMLFTGDAEAETEARLIEAGANLRADVLKVGHHGSRYATSAPFVHAVKPKEAIISVGSANNYGHPSPETLTLLRSNGVKVYRTDLQGEISIISNGERYIITTTRRASDADIYTGRRPH